jgi:Cu-Zn family superoxide dismutase
VTSSADSVATGSAFVAYSDPYGDGRPNPLADVEGEVIAWIRTFGEPGTNIWMSIDQLAKNTNYPAHVHVKPCAPPAKGGGHYQNVPGGPADETNEIHLDFSSDDLGFALVYREVPYSVRSGEARSIVIHDATPDAEGKLPKLACVDVDF